MSFLKQNGRCWYLRGVITFSIFSLFTLFMGFTVAQSPNVTWSVSYNGCNSILTLNLTGFAPNSSMWADNQFSETNCDGTSGSNSWRGWQFGTTDSNGNLTVNWNQGSSGTYNLTFRDAQGNQSSVKVSYGPNPNSLPATPPPQPTSAPPLQPTQQPQPTNPPPPNLPTCNVVSFTITPVSGDVGTRFTLYGKGSCNTGVRAIRFKLDGNIVYELGSPEVTREWNSSGSTSGTHTATIEVAGQGDNGWYAPATQSIQFSIGGSSGGDGGNPPSNQPTNNWQRGNTVYLCQGTEIRVGSAMSYPVTSVVPVQNWAVVVINGPRSSDGATWWDISRAATGDPSGGTGWVRQDQADCGQVSSGEKPPANPNVPPPNSNVPVDPGSSTPIGQSSLRITTDVLNIRSGPDANSTIVGNALKNGYFEISGGPQSGWYEIRFSGGEGWVSGQYVEVAPTTPATGEETYQVYSLKTRIQLPKISELGDVIKYKSAHVACAVFPIPRSVYDRREGDIKVTYNSSVGARDAGPNATYQTADQLQAAQQFYGVTAQPGDMLYGACISTRDLASLFLFFGANSALIDLEILRLRQPINWYIQVKYH